MTSIAFESKLPTDFGDLPLRLRRTCLLEDLPNGLHTGKQFEIVQAIIGNASEWKNNCFKTASTMYDAGFGASTKYGIYSGPLTGGRKYIRQGWLELADGRVCDPTIFHETGMAPGLWIGDYNEHYDISGVRRHPDGACPTVTGASRRPWPEDRNLAGQFSTLSGVDYYATESEGIPDEVLEWLLKSDFVFFEGIEMEYVNYVKCLPTQFNDPKRTCELLHQAAQRHILKSDNYNKWS